MQKINLYEDYHSDRKLMKRLVSSRDYTYGKLLNLIFAEINGVHKALDIGCGVGTISLYLASLGIDTTGIDLSLTGISAAKKNQKSLNLTKNIRFVRQDFAKDKISGKYDLIICIEVLEHIANDIQAVKKIKHLLNKNGTVIASSPSKRAPLHRWGLLDKFDDEVGHLRRYSCEDFVRLFKKNGFRVVKIIKNEGLLRNFLFTNKYGGFLLRILGRWPVSIVPTLIDEFFLNVFGESDYIIVVKRK